jgi:GntR family transcriptional regulator, histidine utilization repressor
MLESPASWQAIQAEVLQRIRNRQWPPGELIPNEADLAEEFGCARATVNRALRELAEAGMGPSRLMRDLRTKAHQNLTA